MRRNLGDFHDRISALTYDPEFAALFVGTVLCIFEGVLSAGGLEFFALHLLTGAGPVIRQKVDWVFSLSVFDAFVFDFETGPRLTPVIWPCYLLARVP